MEPCSRCRVKDWASLRSALGLTQVKLAEMLGLSVSTVKRMEQSRGHRCMPQPALKLLRTWLQEPELRERLNAARYPHPWPEDLI